MKNNFSNIKLPTDMSLIQLSKSLSKLSNLTKISLDFELYIFIFHMLFLFKYLIIKILELH